MSLNVEYGPIGLAGALAVKAGQNEAGYKAQQVAMEQQRLSMEQQAETTRQAAQDKAFSLQEAQASQIALAQRRTPAAEHIAGALSASNLTKQDEQRQSLAQLDDMLEKGQITPTQYQNARAGVMTGSKALVDKAIMPPDQTDPMQKPVFQAQRQMIHDKRTQLYNQMNEIRKATSDDFSAKPPLTGPGSAVEVQKQIDTTYEEEKNLWGDFAPKPAAPETPGSSSMTPFKGWPSSGTTPAAAPAPAAPAWQGHPDGTTFTSRSTGQRFIMQNGQPVPYTPSTAPSAQPAAAQPAAALTDTRPAVEKQLYPEGYVMVNQQEGTKQTMRNGQWVTEQLEQPTQSKHNNQPTILDQQPMGIGNLGGAGIGIEQ
jgi:hypothetical protein